jgi:hypothetical protein
MLGFPGWHADQALSIGRESDHRGRGARSLSVLDHLHNQSINCQNPFPVFRIRIHRIHVFFGLPDPDPLVRGMDPDPALDP